MIELEFVPHHAALIAGQENTLDVLLRVSCSIEQVPRHLQVGSISASVLNRRNGTGNP
jgi:hypothetical protein